MIKTELHRYKYLLAIEAYELEQTLKEYATKRIGNPMKYRNGAMIEFLLTTGVRGSELLMIRPMDLYPDRSAVYCRALKGSMNREIPIKGNLFQRLEYFAEGRPKKEPIFTLELRSLQGIWYEMRPVGCDKKLHSLRHTFSIRLYEKSKDILLLKRALGHKSLQSTLIYSEHLYEHEAFNRMSKEYG